MNRRHFLRDAAFALGGAAILGPETLAAKPASALRLTILHTNDVHSHFEPMEGGEYKGMGGAAARSALVKQLRATLPNPLLLDSGDILQGTPYFNLFNGEPEFRMMSQMDYVASAIGNHDFDAGIERLAELTKDYAKFPLLAANYDFRDTPMKGLTKDSIIVEKEGARIGILGLGISPRGLIPWDAFGETRYNDPIACAYRTAQRLRNDEKCDFIIALSHINIRARSAGDNGEPGDRDLIREVPEIDVVLGGHNHYLLEKPEKTNRRGFGPGYVFQSGWAGTHVGILQFDIYERDKREVAMSGPIVAGNA